MTICVRRKIYGLFIIIIVISVTVGLSPLLPAATYKVEYVSNFRQAAALRGGGGGRATVSGGSEERVVTKPPSASRKEGAPR